MRWIREGETKNNFSPSTSLLNKERTLTADGIHHPQLHMGGSSSDWPGNKRKLTNWWRRSSSCRNLGVVSLKRWKAVATTRNSLIGIHLQVLCSFVCCYTTVPGNLFQEKQKLNQLWNANLSKQGDGVLSPLSMWFYYTIFRCPLPLLWI